MSDLSFCELKKYLLSLIYYKVKIVMDAFHYCLE